MPFEEKIELGSGRLQVCFAIRRLTLRSLNIGEAPLHFRIAARNCRSKQSFCLAQSPLRQVDFSQVYPCFCVAWQIVYGSFIPLCGTSRVRLWPEFSPKHAKLKANAGWRKWRNIAIPTEALRADLVGIDKLAQIRQQRSQWRQVFESTGFSRDLAPPIQHSVEVRTAR